MFWIFVIEFAKSHCGICFSESLKVYSLKIILKTFDFIQTKLVFKFRIPWKTIEFAFKLADVNTGIIKIMKAALIQGSLALALLSQSVQSRTLIQSDLIGETMDGPGIITQNPNNLKNIKHPEGSKLVWDQMWNGNPAGTTRTFRQSFKLVCKEPVTITANGDDGFKLSINGKQVLAVGNNWTAVPSKTVPASSLNFCAYNDLEMRVTNINGGPAGALWHVAADESCTQCKEGQYFCRYTCACVDK